MNDSCNQCWIESPAVLDKAVSAWIEKQRVIQERRLDDLFVLQRWMATTSAVSKLQFPLTIELSEKPDFVLHMEGRSTGLEVTRFLAEQRARAAKIANQEKTWHTPTLFDFDSPSRDNTEIKGMLENSQWRQVQELVVLYAEQLCEIIRKKTEKVIKKGLQDFSSHWLVVEDQHFISEHDLQHIQGLANSWLAEYWKDQLSFDTIFFVSLTEPSQGIVFEKNPQQGNGEVREKAGEIE